MKPAVDFQAMSLPFHIARRYLFAPKSHHAINIISLISVIGVMVSSMALVTVLSVFNGFEDLITGLYGVFDPDLKITGREGKTFVCCWHRCVRMPTSGSFRKPSKKTCWCVTATCRTSLS